jgi:predicted lipoprotein with Yx(FWY)xxD motif
MLTSSRTPLPRRLAAPFVAMALIVGACSNAATTPAPAAATPVPTTAASASAAAGATLAVSETAAVGKFLTGADGKTLYVFTKDTAPNASTCVDACLAKWPALIATGGTAPAAPAGVTGTFATFARPDGTMQVSYNGKPLYYYAPDTKAGDTTGQGVGGVWFVAAP